MKSSHQLPSIRLLFLGLFFSLSIQFIYSQSIHSQSDTTGLHERSEWLKGLSTFDLVLIAQHIAQVRLLDSPYRLLAADVNYSNDVTVTDIVLLRHLLLGRPKPFFGEFNAWRYIRADYVFKNPANPFQEIIPEKGINDTSSVPFIAVKIGDVNNSHTNDGPPGMMRQATLPVGIGQPSHSAGEFFTFPVSYEGAEALAAIQLGLQFDADHWELLEPSTAGLPDYEPGCFNLREAEKGRIKFVWYTPWEKEQLQKGQTLFYLTFRRKTASEVPLMLRTDDEILENTGFSDSGQAYALVATEAFEPRSEVAGTAAPLAWTVRCAPNPVTNVARFQVESPSAKAVSLWVFNALGIRTYYRELSIPAGTTELSIPEAAQWPAGIYTWKVKAGKEKRQGQFVRR
jgi:hypothetical protein